MRGTTLGEQVRKILAGEGRTDSEVLQTEKSVEEYLRGRKRPRRKISSCSQQRYGRWQNLQI